MAESVAHFALITLSHEGGELWSYKSMKRVVKPVGIALLVTLGLAGCNPYDPGQRAVGGAAIGAGTGAALGAIAGGGRGAAVGALIGGGIGAVGGAATTPPPPPPQGYYEPQPRGYYPPPRPYSPY